MDGRLRGEDVHGQSSYVVVEISSEHGSLGNVAVWVDGCEASPRGTGASNPLLVGDLRKLRPSHAGGPVKVDVLREKICMSI